MKRLNRYLVSTARVGGIVLAAAIVLGVIVVAWPMDTQTYLRESASGELLDRNGRLLQAYLRPDDQWCLPRKFDEIHPWLRQATIAVEDKRFHSHGGIDPIAVARATIQNWRSGEIESGASTITMQIVKMQTGSTRNWGNKVAQAVQAFRLDARVDKDTLLTAYLNNAPYGGNLVGVEAAAQRYFGKPVSELRLQEAALIAGLPKSPSSFDPFKRREAAIARRNHVLDRMLAESMITPQEHAMAKEAPSGVLYHPLPMEAPHLGARFASRAAGGAAITTTIDRTIQRMAAGKIAEQVHVLGPAIRNGAAIVVDVQTAEARAHVGSADFFNDHGGQVDATRALRSPGSTLKPFTYACAMQQQTLYPNEVLSDAPYDYGLYNPGNFDGEFYGPVSAADALAASRNIPALTVLERVGYGRLKSFLKETGMTTLTRPAEHYGLGLTLGNCEVRLDELVAAYTMLASGGAYRPLAWEADSATAPRQVLDPGICRAIFDMTARPLEGEYWRDDPSLREGAFRVAWKTGTSTDYRDAWAIVYDGRYVVGVWIGNNDGRSDANLIGSKAALPVAIRIFRALPGSSRPAAPRFDALTQEVRVCARSGLPASQWCAAQRTDKVPTSLHLHRRCDVHYPVTGRNLVAEHWPAGPALWDLSDVKTSAASDSDSAAATIRQVRTRIVQPANNAEFILTGEPDGDTILLDARGSHTADLHWYVDGRYLGVSNANKPCYWKLEEGAHTIACMDSTGATDEVRFHVRHPARRAD